MSDWELPSVDETLCTGSGDCVEVCPTSCLEMNGRVPCMPRPADCISCSLCAIVCPVEAIRMDRE